jgi:hypothetical protein
LLGGNLSIYVCNSAHINAMVDTIIYINTLCLIDLSHVSVLRKDPLREMVAITRTKLVFQR